MDTTVRGEGADLALTRWCRIALLVVMAAAALDWLGWGLEIEVLTRISSTWPYMTPWTALWLAAIAAAVRFQLSDRPGPPARTGQLVASLAAISAVAVLVEYLTGRSLGLDLLWFDDAVRTAQLAPWPGRPSPQTTTSVVLLATAALLTRVDRGRAEVAWLMALASGATVPAISLTAYLFDATTMVTFTSTTGQALVTTLGLLLLVVAMLAARPDRLPLRWLITRPDRRQLVMLTVVIGAFPLAVAACRWVLRACGIGDRAVWTVSTAVSATIIGALAFYLSQRQLMRREALSEQRSVAEQQYRLLADNAVDIVLHLRDYEIAWASPSADVALGEARQQWVGSDLRDRIHPDHLEATVSAWRRIVGGQSVAHRFQIRSGDGTYHWVDGHGKLYFDSDGDIDGIIAALRIIDDQVEIERRLEQLARFDTVTGLVNRAEAIRRLDAELTAEQPAGTHVGILFCDIDHFKLVNDTWGHSVGDIVLAALSERIVECVGPQDTVGRTGGDEIIVILPGTRSLDEAVATADRISRHTTEPIVAAGNVVHATVSIGAAVAAIGEQVTSLIARADAAMYRAKQAPNSTATSAHLDDEVGRANPT